MKRKFLGVAEAAAAMGVSNERVRQLLRAGRILGAERTTTGWVIPIKIRIEPRKNGRPPKPKQ